MPALGAGIHVLELCKLKDLNDRDKPGHDDRECESERKLL